MKNSKNSQTDGASDRLFKAQPSLDFGPIETYVEIEKTPTRCPNPRCHSSSIRRKGSTPNNRIFLHSDNGQLKKIVLIRHRYECRDCKTTFYPSSYNFANNGPFTEEAAYDVTKTVLEHPELSVNKVAKNIEQLSGLSSSSALDRLIKKRKEELSAAIQIIPFYKLFYIPFKYRKESGCCAIIGLNSTEKKLYLLDILKNCSDNELETFFKKTESFKTKVRLSLADMNRSLLDFIESHYSGHVGVLIGLALSRINDYKDQHFALDRKFEALEALKKILATSLKEKYYYASFLQWEKEYLTSDPALSSQLKPLYDEIFSFLSECWIGTFHHPWESEFSKLLSAIYTCERNNVSFEFMTFRLLYANRAATKTLHGENLMRYVRNLHSPIDVPIRSFGVDIEELCRELRKEEEYFLSLY